MALSQGQIEAVLAALLTKDGTVWWEGGDGEPPAEGCLDWMGRPWELGKVDKHGRKVAGATSTPSPIAV